MVSGDNNSVTLRWAPSARSYTYEVLRSTTSGNYSNAVVTTVEQPSTSLTVNGLTLGTPYYFVVRAANLSGKSPNSAQIVATPVGVVTNLKSSWSNSRVTLTWTAPKSATGYKIYRHLDGESFDYSAPYRSQTGTTFLDAGLVNGTPYSYAVRASTTNGACLSLPVSITETPLDSPDLYITGTEVGTVKLGWTPISGAAGYKLFRRTKGGSFTTSYLVAQKGTTYTDHNLSTTTTYQYTVHAFNATGETFDSNVVSAVPSASTTNPTPTPRPTATTRPTPTQTPLSPGTA